jgi:GAF domain-containing protein
MKRNKKVLFFGSLINDIKKIITKSSDTNNALLAICKLLKDNVSYYNWVGFYLVDKSNKRELVLGPFIGEPTKHIRIPFGNGICGQAAERKTTFVVQDIGKETNYLACSSNVQSEIVVPIFKNGEIVGEIDIDSNTFSPFTEEDRKFLENICEIISELF